MKINQSQKTFQESMNPIDRFLCWLRLHNWKKVEPEFTRFDEIVKYCARCGKTIYKGRV